MIVHVLTERRHYPRQHDVAVAATKRLESSSRLPIRRVACEYENGVLFLRGRLPSFYQKQLAQEAVAGLEGVAQIVNEIEVTVPTA